MNKAELFLQDMTYNSEFRILEEAKDIDKLTKVGMKRGMKLPAKDLAIFECIYAFVDRQNKNGCTLPKEEVEKALGTIIGKAVDFDHFRKRVVGHWIDAEIVGNTIIAYGSFYKGNFEEDYKVIKELMAQGNLTVSFEAWGLREGSEDDYDLKDIEFAGGALLIKSEPAFDGANVLELSRKERVLEMAKVMTEPEQFIRSAKHDIEPKKVKKLKKSEKANPDDMEEARISPFDMDAIFRAISDVANLDGVHKGIFDIIWINFRTNQIKVEDIPTGGELLIDLTPQTTVTKKGKKRNVAKVEDLTGISNIEDMQEYIENHAGSDEELEILIEKSTEGPRISYTDRLELSDEDFAVVKQIKCENANKKVRLFPIPDLAHIADVKDRLEDTQVTATLDKLGISKDNVERKILRRAKEITMKEFIEKIQKSSVEEVLQGLAKTTLDRELTEAEFTTAYNIVTIDKPKGDASDTSLMKVPGKKSGGSETSLQNAEEASEDTFKDAIKEAVKDSEDAKKLAEKEEADKVAKEKEEAEAKAKAEAEAKEKEEAEAEAKKKKEEADARQKEIDDAKTDQDKELATLKDELAKAVELSKKYEQTLKDKEVAERKEKLGDFAKDMTDEDVLDDHKYAIALKDKEIAELKAGKKTTDTDPDLTKGSADKDTLTDEQRTRQNVDKYAWGEPEKK